MEVKELERKELLNELAEYLKSKYSVTGITAAEQIDGCVSSAVSFALKLKNDTKTFKLVLIETQKKPA